MVQAWNLKGSLDRGNGFSTYDVLICLRFLVSRLCKVDCNYLLEDTNELLICCGCRHEMMKIG